METRKLGRTGLSVSKICLGTMTFGKRNSEAEGHEQIDRARAAGVNFLDTAEMYPVLPVEAKTVGATEEVIGTYIASRGQRDSMVIATKVTGPNPEVRGGEGYSREIIGRTVDASLKRLQTDYIDLYQLHFPMRGSYHFRNNWTYDPSRQDRAANLAHFEDVLRGLEDAVKAGKIRYVGLSNETAWGTAQFLRIAEEAGLPRMETIQNEYSLLYRTYDTDLAELAVNEDVTLLSYSPLATGMLSGKYSGGTVPEGSRASLAPGLYGRITPQATAASDAYVALAREHGLDPCQMAIAWHWTRPFSCVPIIGAVSMEQLEVALGAADVTLSAEVLEGIGKIHRDYPMPY